MCVSPASSHAPDRGDIARGGPARGGDPDSALPPHHPTCRTVVTIAWGGARGGNPLPGKENHTGPPQGSRAGAGVLGERARAGRKPGVPVPNMCSTGILPYTALLSPPPRPRLRRSSPAPVGGGSSRDITGKACPGCRPRFRPSPAPSHTPLSSHPFRPTKIRAVQAISPEKSAREDDPDSALPSHHPIRRTVVTITRGGARGGNPLPGKENHTGPPTGLPRRSGGSRGKSLGGAQLEKHNRRR